MISPGDGSTLRGLVVYQHLPHYRADVFAELQSGSSIEWTFAADVRSSDGSIPTIPVTQFSRFVRLHNHWRGNVLWQSNLLSLLVRERFDAVVFLGDASYVSTWAGATLSRLLGSRVFFWTIGWHRPERGARRFVRLGFYRLADTLLLYGRTAERIGADMGHPRDRMTVIGNSMSAQPVAITDPEGLVDRLAALGPEVVTAVVRLNPHKGLHLLIRAVARLNEGGRRVCVLLVGTGPDEDRLRQLADELDVELTLLGAVYSADTLAQIYARTSVTVIPLNGGLTCIQSLAHGVPVITTDDPYQWRPESEAVRPGVTGAHYVDGSIDDLAARIECWLDRVRADRDGVSADCRREVAAHWSAQAQASAITAAVEAGLARASEHEGVPK